MSMDQRMYDWYFALACDSDRGKSWMKMLLLVQMCLGLLLASSVLANNQNVKKAGDSKFKVGQKWSYRARPGEEASYFIVVKIDNDPNLGRIIHIAMHGLKIKNPQSPKGLSETVSHMPFAEEAIEKSEVKLLKEKVELPDFKEGYQLWREAFDAGRGGIYTITVAEAVSVMETILNR